MIDWHVRLSLVSTFDVLSITRHHTVHHLDIQNVGGWHWAAVITSHAGELLVPDPEPGVMLLSPVVTTVYY